MQATTQPRGPSPFLTIAEVADLLGVARVRAYEMAAAGAFPTIRLSPRRIRVPRAAFDRWLEDQTQRALANVKREPEVIAT